MPASPDRLQCPETYLVTVQLSDKWKGELIATGELNTLLNRWLSRATLDVIGEGQPYALAIVNVSDNSPDAAAAFNHDCDALDGGGRSASSKGYEDIL